MIYLQCRRRATEEDEDMSKTTKRYETKPGDALIGSCMRCHGLGRFNAFSHVSGGVCFGCGGVGLVEYLPREIRDAGWANVSTEIKAAFLDTGIGWLRNGHKDSLLKARGWRRTVLRLMSQCLKSCEVDLFDVTVDVLRSILTDPARVHVNENWVAKTRAAIVGEVAQAA
jgi:hypothetical protein